MSQRQMLQRELYQTGAGRGPFQERRMVASKKKYLNWFKAMATTICGFRKRSFVKRQGRGVTDVRRHIK